MRTVALALVVLGCAGSEAPAKAPVHEEQAYLEAIRVFCDADRNAGANPDDPLELAAKREEYLLAHVKNSDGIYLLTLFRTRGPAEQADLLEQEATSEKVKDCALIRTLRAEASAG